MEIFKKETAGNLFIAKGFCGNEKIYETYHMG